MGLFSRTFKKAAGPTSAVPTASIETIEPWRESELLKEDKLTRSEVYTYETLDPRKKEIRLLKVHAGQGSQPLRCSMQLLSLFRPSDEYETVSYCWSQSDSAEIIYKVIDVDGKSLRVVNTAAGALFRLRSATSDRILWIDAVCINQNCKDEKGHQVALMGAIYSMGKRNLVWLGDDHDKSHECIRIMDTVLTDIRRRTQDYRTFWATLYLESSADLDPALDSRIQISLLGHLFKSRWFCRLWVAQEVALASDNLCYWGDTSFPLLDILRCAAWLKHPPYLRSKTLRESRGLSNASKLWPLVDKELIPANEYQAAFHELYIIYNRTRLLDCKMPRDKIYALLGMAQSRYKSLSPLLVPDYEHKSDMEVFRDATRFILESGKHPALLNVNHFPPPHPDWPSWVVDFSVRRNVAPLKAAREFCPGYGHRFSMTAEDSRCPNVLRMRGMTVDSIAVHTTFVDQVVMPGQCSSRRVLKILQSVDDLIQTLPLRSQRIAHDEMHKTLIAGVNSQTVEAGPTDLENFNSFVAHLRKFPHAPQAAMYPSIVQCDEYTARARLYFEKFACTVNSRCFFVTKGGLFGIGPGNLQEDDALAVLYGSQMPYVLHPQEEGRYTLVGECYVSRIMHGEAVQDGSAQGKRSEEFEIV